MWTKYVVSLLCLSFGCAGTTVDGWNAERPCGSLMCSDALATLQNPRIIKKTVLSGSEVQITWEQPGAVKALSYRVYIGLPNNGGYMRELPDQLGTEARTFVFGGLSPYATNLVKVVAFAPGMPEAASEVVEIMSYHLLPPPPSSTVDYPGYTPEAFDGRAYLCMPAPNDDEFGVCALPYGQQAEYDKLNPVLNGSVQDIPSTCVVAPAKPVRRVFVSLPEPYAAAKVIISQFADAGGFSPIGLRKIAVLCSSGQWVDVDPDVRYVRVDGVPTGAVINFGLIAWDPAAPSQFVVRTSFPEVINSATKEVVPYSVDIGSL